jgi:hypothetical protein
MFTIAYKTDDQATWKANGETYATKEKALADAIEWLEDGYIVQVVEL